MRKTILIISCLLGILSIILIIAGGVRLYRYNNVGTGDQTNNINQMLVRREDWTKFINDEIVTETEFLDMIDGSTATIPITAEILRQLFNYSDSQVSDVLVDGNGIYQPQYSPLHNTTHFAYQRLIDKEVDLILVTPPSDEELAMARNANVVLDMKPVAKDGFVFITHIDNPITDLSTEQIQKIFSGEYKKWNKVGGDSKRIIMYQREKNSGSQTAMENLVMKGIPMGKTVTTFTIGMMGALVERVAEYDNSPQSIGFTYKYYISNLYKSEKIKMIDIDGINPSDINIENGTYPFSTAYYVIIRDDEAEDSPARRLRDFLLSEVGQQLVAYAGYIKGQSI